MTEESKVKEIKGENKKELHLSFQSFIKSLRAQVRDFLNVDKDADIEGTVANIKRDAQFEGFGVWILIFSIFIASIGLNLNSTAVIIGAMLISPLMGPIQGIGLSIATNDFETLLSSFRNLVIMVFVALLTSSLFFAISPFQDAESELLSRTKPNLFDAFVAIFGGLSGIIAGSRSERGNVIPGVAIATALMPPLCTAGYGLATFQMDFFFGAFYLFLLNSAFICISTIVVSKYLRIPVVRYVDPSVEKKIRLFIYTLAFVVIIPSLMTLFYVSMEEQNERKIKDFVQAEMSYKKTLVFESNYYFNTDTASTVKVLFNTWFQNSKDINSKVQFILTGESVDSTEEVRLKKAILNYVPNITLDLLQAKDKKAFYTKTIGTLENKAELIEEAYKQARQKISEQTKELELTKIELEKLRIKTIPVEALSTDIVSFYTKVKNVEASYMKSSKGTEIPTFIIYWEKSIAYKEKMTQSENIKKWLKKKLEIEELQIINL